MHPDEHVLAAADRAEDECDVLTIVVGRGVPVGGVLAVTQRHSCTRYPLHQLLEPTPIRDEIRDRDHRQPVLVGKGPQLLGARHPRRILLADDLAQHASRPQTGQLRQVDGGLGVPGSAQDATVLGAQRHDVARTGQVRRRGR